jgi:cell division septation protein DedD
MRWFFLLLLVFNIGYVAWELKRERPQHAYQAALPKGVQRIVLLRELKPGTAAKQDFTQLSNEAIAQEPAIKPSEDDSTPPQQAESSKTLAEEVEVSALGNIAAVEEHKAEAENQGAAPAEEPANRPVAKPAGDLCYTLGPFSEMKTLRIVTREIKDYVVEASFRSKEEQEQTMFRVLVRPVGSKQEARDLIKELVSKNIKDNFILTDGPNKNGISLGYFSNKGRAYRHAGRVRKLGFDAIAEPVFRTYTIYWLDYRIKAGNEFPQQIVDEHLENSAQRLSRDCT